MLTNPLPSFKKNPLSQREQAKRDLITLVTEIVIHKELNFFKRITLLFISEIIPILSFSIIVIFFTYYFEHLVATC